MPTIRHRGDELSSKTVRKLSCDAIGFFAKLRDLPDGTVCTVDEIVSYARLSKHKTRNLTRELKKHELLVENRRIGIDGRYVGLTWLIGE